MKKSPFLHDSLVKKVPVLAVLLIFVSFLPPLRGQFIPLEEGVKEKRTISYMRVMVHFAVEFLQSILQHQ